MSLSIAQQHTLLQDLASPDAKKRLDAAIKLGQPGYFFAVNDLVDLAQNDPDHKVRKAAINSLGKIGDRYAYSTLEKIWKNSNEPSDIRDEALKACDRLDGIGGDNDDGSRTDGDRDDDDGLGGI